MPNPNRSLDAKDGMVLNPVLREADPRDLEAASEELRERTMSLEPEEHIPGKRLLAVLLTVGAVAAVCTFKFRGEIKAMLGLS